ncbi:MAG: dihydropteroate synthase [Candidatus Acetothermia bacterium]|jgi:dihydropteroate synthase|nr:dihydropteroate synthase [Candidatus Acetothermia bacterium]MDH7504723.1 dihydropteroate synthase [Candidatus Acetothermia bacterium]
MGLLAELGKRTLIMGILNVTPDSFSDGGLYLEHEKAIAHGLKLVEDGADIVDVGGESTRPGADPVPLEEELRRVIPVIEGLRSASRVTISIDTYKAAVAEAALRAGADMINDISAMRFDPRMAEVVRKYDVPVVLMHMQGEPRTMQANPHYNDLVGEVGAFLQERLSAAAAAGIAPERLILDPGIGFGKTVEHNLELLRRLAELKRLGRPILIGPSRKSFIGRLSDLPPGDRLPGTIATVVLGIANGADIVRVHDVLEVKRAVQVADAIIRGDRKWISPSRS